MPASPRPVMFIYTPTSRGSGTTVMRGEQLSKLLRRHDPERRVVRFLPVDDAISGADLFLTKNAARQTDPLLLERWRRQGNRIFLDPVDEDLPDAAVAAADAIVAASITAERRYRTRWPATAVVRVDHHVDPRLRSILKDARPPRQDRLDARYFGELVNTVRTERIARVVDFVQVDTSRRKRGWMRRVPGANLHYAVRARRGLDYVKPFLKGFTAATAGALILPTQNDREAQAWLGEDYPFWVASDADEHNIMDTLYAVHEAFGTAVWRDAEVIMRDIAARTTDEVIVGQLLEAFA